jgi:hypothetical protein
VIEVGSGFSSAVMLDVRDRHLPDTHLTFVEPYADRLRSLLTHADHSSVRIIETPVQDVDLKLFDELGEDDILFIDSTHVSKTGSDVNFEFFEIFPRLRPGVVIHLHDIFYPFEYPRGWVVDENRGWNELYLLRAFLASNQQYQMMLWLHLFMARGHQRLTALSPGSGSFWMRKL